MNVETGQKYTKTGTSNYFQSVVAQNSTHFTCFRNSTATQNTQTDLKYLSVTVDGVEVFSGNKTGIDTIKPDDFKNAVYLKAFSDGTHTIYSTEISNPTVLYNADGSTYTGSDFTISDGVVYYNGTECSYTSSSNKTLTLTNTTVDAGVKISSDGILTNFEGGNGNRLYKSLGISTLSNFEYDFSFVAGTQNGYVQHPGLATFLLIFLNLNSQIDFQLFKQNAVSVENSLHGIGSLGSLSGKKIYVKIIFNNGQGEYRVKVENGNWKSITYTSTDLSFTPYFSNLEFARQDNNTVTAYDLNDVRFYNNGNLVYQPCLKIPYTESFTGSKIAQSIYRDRVVDAYEQGYPQRYYTLSDTDFTLPCGELYGELEQKVCKSDLQEVICIVEQYTFSDANAFCWDLSNGWRIQGARQTVTTTGNMTVPLLKPFANTSYLAFKNYDAGSSSLHMLDGEGSIFSKTETSFVTYNSTSDTTSFDWFAIGKIA